MLELNFSVVYRRGISFLKLYRYLKITLDGKCLFHVSSFRKPVLRSGNYWPNSSKCWVQIRKTLNRLVDECIPVCMHRGS
jgi:hypothetical protein